MGSSAFDMSALLSMAASETLEALAFTEINPSIESSLQDGEHKYQGARISLGTMGNLDLIIEKDLLEEIAIILFNPPTGEIAPEMLSDTLNEILNIIAGRFLDAVFKGKSDFSLGIPEMHLDVKAWNTLPIKLVLLADAGKQLGVGISPETHAG